MERTWETCIAFHGHPCPVLATGYRASVEALRILHITELHREKLACIAENQVCGVDAVQIMLNCTLAKGNIIIHGTHYGSVHAGAAGDRNAFIIALSMQPQRLVIGDIEAKRQLIYQDSLSINGPQIAVVDGKRIYLDPLIE